MMAWWSSVTKSPTLWNLPGKMLSSSASSKIHHRSKKFFSKMWHSVSHFRILRFVSLVIVRLLNAVEYYIAVGCVFTKGIF